MLPIQKLQKIATCINYRGLPYALCMFVSQTFKVLLGEYTLSTLLKGDSSTFN